MPPDAERLFAARWARPFVEVASGHVAMVSHPGEVVKLIEAAADSAAAS